MRVVETAYRLDLSDDEWLGEIARSGGATLGDPGLFHSASIIRSGSDGFVREGWVFVPKNDAYQKAADRIERLCPREVNATKYRTTTCDLASDLARRHGLPATIVKILFRGTLGRWGTRDVIQVQGSVLGDLSIGITASLRSTVPLHARFRRTWSRVGVHLAAGLRLRRAVRSLPSLVERADLILERTGEVAHARGPVAESSTLREALREHARAVDQARGNHDDPERATELWAGLFSGRWSILETFDTDGRSYVVACENEPEVQEDRSLTRRERQVFELVAQGNSDDFVAYALGLSIPTIRTHLTRALAKTGMTSRTALVQAAATLGSPVRSEGKARARRPR